MELRNSKTFVNLARAYAGECQARTRYEFIEYGEIKLYSNAPLYVLSEYQTQMLVL
jgi:hypothetical protein